MQYTGKRSAQGRVRRSRAWYGRNGAVFATALLCPGTGMFGVQSQGSLANTLRGQVADEKLLGWSAGAPPSWNEFRGTPTLGTPTAAQTSSGVTYLIQCRGRSLRFAVLATFSPKASWVRPDIPGDSLAGPRSLRHERTHFDLSELFARRLRRAFARLDRACPGREDEVRRVFDRLAEESRAEQERYDRETAHGMAGDVQARWERQVQRSLRSLGGYAEPIGRE
jgi:hypothetical protein